MIQALLISISLYFLPIIGPVAEPRLYELSADQFFDLESVQSPIDPEHFDRKLLEAAIFYASNEVRRDKGKSAFGYDSILNTAARFHADYLEEKQLVNHLNRHDKKYRTPYDRTVEFDGDFSGVAENLARLPVYKLGSKGEFFMDEKGRLMDKNRQPLKASTYAELARHVVDGWMHSKGHRENLMGEYKLLGTGVSEVGYNKNGIPELYLIQNFGNH